MAFITDYTQINAAGTAGDWTASGFDSPTLNDSAATTPIYIEAASCMWWPLKKGTTDGYVYDDVTVDIAGRLIVAWLNYPLADIANIPITELFLQVSSDTGLNSTNWSAWNALAQIVSPLNVPISGHTPVMAYPTNPDESAGTTVYTSIDSVGWRATTGGTADGKQGGFDMFFAIGWVGEHSETFTNTFFDDLYEESYDADGGGLPGTANRPLGVVSRSGDFFQFNVNIQLGDGTSDTANLVVDETGKTIFFSNVEPEHELGYVFVDPASTHEVRLSLTDCVHFWTSQQSTHEIFTDTTNATYFKITGCAFTNGGKVTLPSDTANRWVRSTKFDSCQAVTISDGEFTGNTVANGEAITVSGDADLTGTSVLTPVVAADAAGLVWNGNFDPDGNLDGMTFSKGTNAHHAIEFGTSSPLTMTLRGIDFSGFNATDAQNDSTFHVLRTSGTVTINAVGCTGNLSYKSAGATVVISVNPVTTLVNVKTRAGVNIQNARVLLRASAGPLPFEASVTIANAGTTATVTHTAHGLDDNDYVEIEGASLFANNGVFQITYINANSYSYTMASTPGSSPTGSITSTFVALTGLTDASGNISALRTFGADQPIAGKVRKSTATPFYKTSPVAGTISSTAGFTANVQMILDE